jgi:2-hydroxychromene-2-carboxylate isomerase
LNGPNAGRGDGAQTKSGAAPIHFWFDFISPFGYFASLRIDALAASHGRSVVWHPLLIGVTVLKVMGLKPVLETPLKGDYAKAEIARYCRRHQLRLKRPVDAAPMNPLPAARVLAWLQVHAPQQALAFARAALHAHWQHNISVDNAAALAACADEAGLPAALVMQALADPQAAVLLRTEVDSAIKLGVFGSPFFRVDGEAFFGVDKLELLDDWLRCGGW